MTELGPAPIGPLESGADDVLPGLCPVNSMRSLLGIVLISAFAWLVPAGASPIVTDNVTARLVSERAQSAPGDTIQLALVFDIRPGWHTYWRNPGDSGEATRIRWRVPHGAAASPIRWTRPDLIRVGPLANHGYSGRAVHLIDLAISQDWVPGRPIDLVADASWLACAEYCVPESGTLSLRIETRGEAGPIDAKVAGIFSLARSALPQPLPGDANLRADGAGLLLTVDSPALPPVL